VDRRNIWSDTGSVGDHGTSFIVPWWTTHSHGRQQQYATDEQTNEQTNRWTSPSAASVIQSRRTGIDYIDATTYNLITDNTYCFTSHVGPRPVNDHTSHSSQTDSISVAVAHIFIANLPRGPHTTLLDHQCLASL